MEQYIKPQIEIIYFDTEDIISTSNQFRGDEGGGNAHFDP